MPASRIAKLLLREIKRQRLTQYRIAADTGIPQPCLSRFLNGGSLKMETAGLLLDYLGYEITAKK
ncbi:MAG: helix-turn-helix domain-containing protein [Pirellulaceae bacterium]|jgi:predicted XRE-type DNA-binding protein|nr:helix-turn-helix domain-containing protein [Pirellulaceae bacterium]HJN08633.1 helix-turn-helix domain-containing protein [Pirellulaceae bacterium]